MFWLIIAVAAFWWLLFLRVVANLVSVPRLPRGEETPAGETPSVSVVIAARDEQRRIEKTIRGLWAQQGIDLQLIVVDDRSTDKTPTILARLAEENPQLQVVTIEQLPDGWLGKCHACHVGSSQATGDWVLFTDADIHMSPDLIARSIAAAQRAKADHIALLPGLNCTGLLTRASVTAFGQLIGVHSPLHEINRDRGRGAVGIGAFNLVRREALQQVGGYQELRMEVVDDMKLGLLIRRAGFRQRVFVAVDELEAEWAHSIWQVIRALEKNWFAAMNYNVLAALSVVMLAPAIWFTAAPGSAGRARLGLGGAGGTGLAGGAGDGAMSPKRMARLCGAARPVRLSGVLGRGASTPSG